MTYCNGSDFGSQGESGGFLDGDTRKEMLELLGRTQKIAKHEHLGMIQYLVSLAILEVLDTPELHKTGQASTDA